MNDKNEKYFIGYVGRLLLALGCAGSFTLFAMLVAFMIRHAPIITLILAILLLLLVVRNLWILDKDR